MLQFEYNHLIKGLSYINDATKNGIHHYISDKTKKQISRGTEGWWARKCNLKTSSRKHDKRSESHFQIWTLPNASINTVCWFIFIHILFSLCHAQVDELQDICWALGQNNKGTKDILIATIKLQLTHMHAQDNPKLVGLYIGHCPAANKNWPPQSPLTFPPPAPAHQSSILQTVSLANPPPSLTSNHIPSIPAEPSIHPPSHRSYYPLQPRPYPLTNVPHYIVYLMPNNLQQAVHNDFSTIQPSQFYSQ